MREQLQMMYDAQGTAEIMLAHIFEDENVQEDVPKRQNLEV